MNNEKEQLPSDIIKDIDDFLSEGKNGEKPTPAPVKGESAALVVAKQRLQETPLPPRRTFPWGMGGITEKKEKKWTDPDTKEEWTVPDWTFDERTPDVPQTHEELLRRKKKMNATERIYYNQGKEDWEYQMDWAMKEKVPAVIIVGESGVGKTTMIEERAASHGWKVAYFNAPTMDPYIQLVGIPYVHNELGKQCLKFIRKNDLEEVDMIFLDEVNRPREAVQNQLFELIGAHSINGRPFRKLKSVWAAINPPREDITRYVSELDTALQGRWHSIIHVKAAPKMHHFAGPKDQIGIRVAEICLNWWYTEIKGQVREGKNQQDVHLQDIITPRVLGYIMWVCQRLENARLNPRKDPETGQLEPPMSTHEWSINFNMIAQHHKLSSKTWGVKMPFEHLKRALLGERIGTLGEFRNTSADIEEWEATVAKDQIKAADVANKISEGLRGTVIEGPAKIPFSEIGDFSRILCAMNPNFSAKALSDQAVCGYLWVKNHKTPEERAKIAADRGNPDDPIASELTQGEQAIYEHDQKHIDQVVQTNIEVGQEKKKAVGRAAAGGGGPKVAGGLGTPVAPVTGAPPGRPGGTGGTAGPLQVQNPPHMPFGKKDFKAWKKAGRKSSTPWTRSSSGLD